MSELNIELLTKVRDKIAANPDAYDQTVFARPFSVAPCGTAACIAGWACVLSGEMDTAELLRRERAGGPDFDSIPVIAQESLGLTSEEARTLFTSNPDAFLDGGDVFSDREERGWPEPFCSDWNSGTRRDSPEIAVAYLNQIIETGKIA